MLEDFASHGVPDLVLVAGLIAGIIAGITPCCPIAEAAWADIQ